ncbi:unnamed protein product [Arabidopsis halleri]
MGLRFNGGIEVLTVELHFIQAVSICSGISPFKISVLNSSGGDIK